MIRHLLTGPDLDAALDARQAALQAGADEVWVLPGGTVNARTIGRVDAALQLESVDGTTLSVTGGPLEIVGTTAGARHLDLDGALVLRAQTVVAESVEVRVYGSGTQHAIELDGISVDADEIVARARSTDDTAVALRVRADTVRIADLDASAEGDGAVGADIAGRDEVVLTGVHATASAVGEAVGLRVQSAEVELVEIEATTVEGQTGVGLEAISTGSLLALDLRVRGVVGSTASIGVLALAAGALQLRGLTIRDIGGGTAHGLLASANTEASVTSGRVEDIAATGPAASGVRVVLANPLAPCRVADLHIEGVGAVGPRADATPPVEWQSWAQTHVATLGAAIPGAIPRPPLPAGDAAADTVGLHVHADASLPAVRTAGEVPALRVEDLVVYRVGGTALQVAAGFRGVRVGGVALWASARAGWVGSESADLEALTAHSHLEPLFLGPGVYDLGGVLMTGSPPESVPTLGPEAEYDDLRNCWSDTDRDAFRPLDGLPYREPGPVVPPETVDGTVPPPARVDLRLVPTKSPTDPAPGAFPVVLDDRCVLHDPRPEDPLPSVRPEPPGPDVDYRVRDAQGFFELMRERATVAMPTWSDGTPADFTWMLFEALAHRLDQLAYAQEGAVSEGFLESARLRASVEDHVRPLDYVPDPGLSATTLIQVEIDRDALAARVPTLEGDVRTQAEAFRDRLDGAPYPIPAETLVATTDPSERPILFETESQLAWSRELSSPKLLEDCLAGSTSAVLEGELETLEVGRWMVLSRGPGLPGHAIRVTAVEAEPDRTTIHWDPRRPTHHAYPAVGDPERGLPPTSALGNVVPAHHGVTLRQGRAASMTSAWEEALRLTAEPGAREVLLPLGPVAVRSSLVPLPAEGRRQGRPCIRVTVDGETWTRVDDLSLAGPTDEVYALRAGSDGAQAIRFGAHGNGAELSEIRPTSILVEATIGLGDRGNVGANTLTRLLRFGAEPSPADALWDLGLMPDPPTADWLDSAQHRDDLVGAVFRVTNPLPAQGGRDPERLDRMRYRAPLQVRQAISAITLDDLEERIAALPEVVGARASELQTGLRNLVQVTVLLRDLDTLPEAEVLRRWAVVRQAVEQVRLAGLDVEVVPPTWVPLDLDLSIEAAEWADADAVRRGVEAAIAGDGGVLDPDRVGLGGDVHLSGLLQAAQSVDGVDAARVLRLRRLERDALEYKDEGTLPVGAHEIATVGGAWLDATRAAFTVTVCGGRT